MKILNQIDNPNGRVQFKDVRKINIDILKMILLKIRSPQKVRFIIAL